MEWTDDLQKGKRNECEFISCVNSHLLPGSIEVDDVSGNDEYRKKDIDFIFIKKTKVELKSANRYGRICIEIYDNTINYNHKGWYFKCEADKMIWLSKNNNWILIADWNKLKMWMESKVKNKDNLYIERDFIHGIGKDKKPTKSLCYWIHFKKMMTDNIELPFIVYYKEAHEGIDVYGKEVLEKIIEKV
jgi:hypothetical protein